MKQTQESDRRPLASRQTAWAQALTQWLANSRVTPNQISMASVLAAAVSVFALWLAVRLDGGLQIAALLSAAVFLQLRLLCNLLDGMVAIEAGKQSADGGVWNELPDRVADIIIFAGFGATIGHAELGWATACLAVLTAYVRELGTAQGVTTGFCGPMAKPHRMAALTIALILSAVFSGLDISRLTSGSWPLLVLALWIIAGGALLTAVRRSVRLLNALNP